MISPFVVAELDYMLLRRYGRQTIGIPGRSHRGAYLLESFKAEDFAAPESCSTITITCRTSASPTPPTRSWRSVMEPVTSLPPTRSFPPYQSPGRRLLRILPLDLDRYLRILKAIRTERRDERVTSPVRISRANSRPRSGPSVTPLCVTAS